MEPYERDAQLRPVLTVERRKSTVPGSFVGDRDWVVVLEAQVVGSDLMVEERRARWVLGRVERSRKGLISVINEDRRNHWSSKFGVPNHDREDRWSRKANKFADWISDLISPQRNLRGTKTVEYVARQIYGQVAVAEVMDS